jgi:hypothetical protein
MSDPEKIVSALLEDEFEDPKEFMDRNSEEMLNKWEQIAGDSDAWTHGGSWFNPFKQEIVHVNGLEGEGLKEVDSYDLELDPQEEAKLNADFPPFIDPDFPEDGDQNERDREIEKESILAAKADKINTEIKIPVYRFLDEELDDWPQQDLIAAQFEEGFWDKLSTADKWIEVGKWHGFQELDAHPDSFTKAELSKYLGLAL